MENNENQVAEKELKVAGDAVPTLRVYRKKSTFKGATEKDFWYSATLSNGNSAILKFKKGLAVPDLPAFEVSNVIGQDKSAPVKDDEGNVIYDNHIYYITSCDFHEIKGEPLPL